MQTRLTAKLVLGAAVLAVLALGACKKSGGKDGDKAEGKAAGPKTVALGKLGIQAELPSGAEVSEAPIGGGVMVRGEDLVMTIEDGAKKPADPEIAKEDASMYSPQGLKVEKLEGGFVMTFTNKGGMGTNYWLMGRREIEGKAYWCSTTASRPEQLENAVKVCKGLKK
ncbi:MAG: hypothetical protein RBU30_17430 [Polyangia bacterium]|nr:hypothetical protein [Polyangia bacterium]